MAPAFLIRRDGELDPELRAAANEFLQRDDTDKDLRDLVTDLVDAYDDLERDIDRADEDHAADTREMVEVLGEVEEMFDRVLLFKQPPVGVTQLARKVERVLRG